MLYCINSCSSKIKQRTHCASFMSSAQHYSRIIYVISDYYTKSGIYFIFLVNIAFLAAVRLFQILAIPYKATVNAISMCLFDISFLI